MNVEKLVKRAAEGDTSAFGELYEAFAPKMRSVALHILRDRRDEAADVVHDAFLIAMATIDRLREPKRCGSWLAAITANLALRQLEESGRRAEIDFEETDLRQAVEPAAEEETEEGLSAEELQRLVDQLPEGYRRVLRLYVVEGLSHQEIARRLHIAPHTSSSQLARAKAMLRRLVASHRTVLLLVVSVVLVTLYRYFAHLRREGYAPAERLSVRPADRPSAPPRRGASPAVGVPPLAHWQNSTDTLSPKFRISAPAAALPEARSVCASAREPMADTLAQPAAPLRVCQPPLPAAPVAAEPLPVSAPPLALHRPEGAVPAFGGHSRSSRWKMLLAGSVTPAALHSAYRLLASAGNSIPDSDGWPTEPTAFATWEDFYEDLSANHAGTTATDTLTLLHIAKHNHGNIVERERHAAPFTFGLSLTRQLGRRWGLETGLEYTLLRSSTTMGEGSNYILRRQRVHYLGIPLRLSYRPIDFTDRLSLYASAGLTMHIPLSAGRRSYLVTDSIPLSIQAEQVSAPWRVELDASLGLQYRLTPHMSLYLAPSVSCFLPSNSAVRTTWSARPFTLSAPLGLRFTW